jgi:protein gp37
MGEHTGIEWTDSTWNPVTGCTRVSSGCDNCYAATLAEKRLRHVYLRTLPVVNTEDNRADAFAVRLWPERLDQPILWTDARMIFVNSMSDLFHVDVPDEYVLAMFDVMFTADWHIYQVLTKRPARAARFWEKHAHEFGGTEIPQHIWIGTSIENEDVAYRARHLRRVRATIRFLSCEPLLGPLGDISLDGIHWVIGGGESGSAARPVDLSWAISLRDRCVRSNVPFFWKQWGGRTPKAGGRLLEGEEWNEYPRIGVRSAA